jgi:hypothetical protein
MVSNSWVFLCHILASTDNSHGHRLFAGDVELSSVFVEDEELFFSGSANLIFCRHVFGPPFRSGLSGVRQNFALAGEEGWEK